jgi:hypothetical protein
LQGHDAPSGRVFFAFQVLDDSLQVVTVRRSVCETSGTNLLDDFVFPHSVTYSASSFSGVQMTGES